MDTPKLRVPLIAFLLAALCLTFVLRVKALPDWVRFYLAAVAIILGVVGIVTLTNWLVYSASERIRQLGDARTLPMRQVANAIRDLNTNQAEAILSMNMTYVEMLAAEAGPKFLVRTLTRVVPYEFVDDFFEKCTQTDPYLYPVHECSNKDWGAALTNYIVSRGWADHATGSLPAKFTLPVSVVAKYFGVELEEEEEVIDA